MFSAAHATTKVNEEIKDGNNDDPVLKMILIRFDNDSVR